MLMCQVSSSMDDTCVLLSEWLASKTPGMSHCGARAETRRLVMHAQTQPTARAAAMDALAHIFTTHPC